MPDNRDLLKARIGKLGLAPGREDEIFRELAEHLEDHAAALETHGVAREEATREALDSVSDWPGLREEILSAETEETIMNYRTKVLWLPALCALTLSNGLLVLMQIFGPPPHFYWLGAGMSGEPYYVFIVPWLISQPVVGAVAAYWSRRAGGTVLHQLIAALAPAIALLGLFLLILPWAMIVDKNVSHHTLLSGLLVLTVSWVLLPSVPLLIGTAPFLCRRQSQV
jgi:hypothetical protein